MFSSKLTNTDLDLTAVNQDLNIKSVGTLELDPFTSQISAEKSLFTDSVFNTQSVEQMASALSQNIASSSLPDLIVNSGDIGNGVTGDYYDFSYTITNQGSSAAGYSYTEFYLSPNTIWSSADTYIGYDYVASLSAGASRTESVSLYLDDYIEPGDYYLFVNVDAYGNVTESDGSNNLRYFTAPISISASDNAGNTRSSARSITLGSSTTTYRDWVGSTDTNDYYKFTLSNTSNLNLSLTGLSSDGEVELLNSSGTKIAESINSDTNDESIIRQLSAGTYYIRVYPYSGNTYYNLNLSATVAAKSDLTINSINATTGFIGTPLNFTYSIKNQGNDAPLASNTAFYLSTDTTLDSSDTYLGVDSVASLAAGASRTESASVSLAGTLTEGTYYLFASSDNENILVETNETNNIAYQAITLKTPATVSISASDANAAETNSGQTANRGRFTLTRAGDLTDSLTVNYGVSGTATNGTDYNTLSGSVTFAAGASTATFNVTPINDTLSEQTETVSATLNAGTGYILGTNSSATVNLADNDFAITVTSPNGGQTFDTLSTYNITWTDNISENVKIDLYKGGTFLRTLFTSTASDGSETWTVPNDLTVGSNYKIRIASVTNNAIADFSNTNFSIAKPPRPDLVVVNPQQPAIFDPLVIGTYGSASYSYTLKNQGQATAVNQYGTLYVTTQFYLSNDTSLSNDDVYLGKDSQDFSIGLAPGNSFTVSHRFYIENKTTLTQLASGEYYILYKTDSSNQTIESNENNNIGYRTTTLVKPDLVIKNQSAPAIAQIGGNLTVSYDLMNQGPGDARWIGDTRFYFSKDATFSSDDIYLDYEYISSLVELDPGEYVTQNVTLNLPNSITAGTYYLFFHVDGSREVNESNENNNFAYVTLDFPVYSSTSGYGLVNAAAAVAKALGQNPFPDVPTWGGDYDWGANMINAPEVWAKGYTGQGITVAVLDTGVDYNHLDLRNNIWVNSDEIAGDGIDNDNNGYIDDVRGWDFAYGDNNPMDVDGHGTHVAGTIAARRNNSGVTGIAYNAKIMPVKVLNDEGSGSQNNIAKGIYYAVDNGARVINMSLGGGYTVSSIYQEAFEYAASKGVIVVIAAGNSFDNEPELAVKPNAPALYATNTGIAVGAVDGDNDMTSFSNRAGSDSNMAYVTAPGYRIYSTYPGQDYEFLNGTSMAAPHVAGVVALMLSANPNLTDAQVRQILTSTSSHNVLGSTNTNSQSLSTIQSNSVTTQQSSQSFTSNLLQSTPPVSSQNKSTKLQAIAPGPSSENIIAQIPTPPVSSQNKSTKLQAIAPVPSSENIITQIPTPPVSSQNKSTNLQAIAVVPSDTKAENLNLYNSVQYDEITGETPLFALDDLLTFGLA